MNEVELEAMLVRLTGDGSSYQKMMHDAQVSATETASHIEGVTGKIHDLVSTAGEALLGLGTAAWLREGLHAWDEQEKANIKLNALLVVNGRNVQELTGYYEDFATEMQHLTTLADETTLGILAQAESFNLTGEAATRATQAAIGFAAINDGNAKSYLRFTAAMERGDTHMMQRMARMIPQLRGIKDETELMEKATRLAAAGFDVAQKQAQTFSGQVTQLKNAYNDFMEDVGKTLADVLKPVVAKVIEWVYWMKDLGDGVKKIIVFVAALTSAALLLGPALKTLVFFTSLINPLALAIIAAGIVLGAWVESVGGVAKAWEQVKESVEEFIETNRTLLIVLGVSAATIGTVVLAYKLLAGTIGLVNGLLTALYVYKVAGIALWLVYKVAVWAAVIAVNAFNVSIGVGLVVLGLMAVALVSFVAAGYAAWGVLTQLYEALTSIPTTFGPVAHIIDIFSEIGGVLKNVVRAAKTDLPLAWQILEAGFELAVSRIKDMWPPLWDFIKTGSGVVWTLIKDEAVNRFVSGLEIMREEFAIWSREIAGLDATMNRQMLVELQRLQAQTTSLNQERAQRALTAAAQTFNVIESAETQHAREYLQQLRDRIPLEAERERRSAANADNEDKAAKAAHKFDAALMFSVEAFARIAAYQDTLSGNKPDRLSSQAGLAAGSLDALTRVAAQSPVPGENPAMAQLQEYMRRTAEATEQQARRPGVVVEGANL